MRVRVIRVLIVLGCLPLLTVAAPSHSEPSARMWDLVRSVEWDLTVRSVERRGDPLAAADGTPVRPTGRFAIFVVDLTNRTGRPLTPPPDAFVLWSAEGGRAVNIAATAAARAYAAAAGFVAFGDVVLPGATVTTVVMFDIDARAGRLTLHFLPANQLIRIDECKCNLPSPVRSVAGR